MIILSVTGVVILCFGSATSSVLHCEVPELTSSLFKQGLVNAVLVANSDCEICHKQIEFLPDLYDSFVGAGVDINMIISNHGDPVYIDDMDTEFTLDNTTAWKELESQNGDIFIFDRCGRLTFQVYQRWAIPGFPFVKAAVLSTFYDDPCGECYMIPPANQNNSVEDSAKIPVYPELAKQEKEEMNMLKVKDGKVPLKIVLHLEHTHAGDSKRYRLIELLSGNPNYHRHPKPLLPTVGHESGEQDLQEDSQEDSQEQEDTTANKAIKLTINDREQNKEVLGDQNIKNNKEDETSYINDKNKENELKQESKQQDDSPESESKKNLAAHYQKLVQWVNYVL